MRGDGMGRRLGSVALLAALVATPSAAGAQAYFIDAAIDQAYASDPLPSPLGFSLALGRTSLLGPLGLQVSLRSLFEHGGSDIAQKCDLSGCTAGPFDQSFSMRMISFGLSYDFRNPTGVYLDLGLNAGSSYQIEHLTHVETGQEMEERTDSDFTLGGSMDLRLRRLIGPFRPAFGARYDRVFASPCDADAACFPDRSVWSLSAGLSWVAPAR